jgi:hypothetical protein
LFRKKVPLSVNAYPLFLKRMPLIPQMRTLNPINPYPSALQVVVHTLREPGSHRAAPHLLPHLAHGSRQLPLVVHVVHRLPHR